MTVAGATSGATVRSRPLLLVVVLANCLVVAVTAAAAVLVARHSPGAIAVVALVAGGICLSVLVNVLLLREASRDLTAIREAMDAVHKGELERRLGVGTLDPGLRRVLSSFNAMCARLEDESRQYSARLISSIEEERRRIGRELHDETSQTLAATLVNLDLAEKAFEARDLRAARERVTNAKALIDHSIEEIKLLVYDLRPVMLDDFGLAPTLRWYIKSHLQDAGPAIVTDFDNAGLRLPNDVETALYRSAQEILANAVHHASATKVVVRLETRPGYADLAVIDNGRGFDPEAVMHSADRRGVGLLSIKERVELVGGTVNIESVVGRGTRVYAVIPFETETDDREKT